MEAEIANANHVPGVIYRSLPAFLPVLMVSIGYLDPGKWAATVEGGARFGFDLVALALAFNFSAVMCQYLSARIGVVTGKDLAEICSDEYDSWTCMFLGIQTELSVIALDLGMILGMAHGLNLVFGWDLFTCVLLTAANTILFPMLALLLENQKAKLLSLCMIGFVLLSYILGVLGSQPEIPLSFNGVLLKFNGESALYIMSLLGAYIMPHNFYLHSSIIQWHRGPANVSKDELCHIHLFAILFVFSGIYLVNYVLMNAAANVFYSSGLVLLTFQDALSLMEQVFRSPVAPFAFLLILFISNQLTAITWSLGGQVVLHHFLKLHIPGWLHYATIRIVAIVPAFYCVFSTGAEGMYQLLLFTQVMVALLIPSSLIPLFRVATSRSIMGANKISQLMEFLALSVFIGILGLNIIFVVEMIFGSSDWVVNLRWTVGSGISIPYLFLLIAACASFCLMLWLAATPLKSASIQVDAQMWNWDVPKAVSDPRIERDKTNFAGNRYVEDAPFQKQEALPAVPKATDHSDVSVAKFSANLPDTLTEPKQESPLTPINKNHATTTIPSSALSHEGDSPSTSEPVPVQPQIEVSEAYDPKLLDTQDMALKTTLPDENSVAVDETICTDKDDDGDTWDGEELPRTLSAGPPSLTSDGPPSFRSLSGKSDKSDDGGNNAGSLSNLAGLGRAGRRQLTVILGEFWGQLFDSHGQATDDSKSKRFDLWLRVDPKSISPSGKKDAPEKEYAEYLPGGKGPEFVTKSGLFDSSMHQRVQNSIDASYGVHMGSSSMWPNVDLYDGYAHNSGRNVLDSGERRYSSVRSLPSSEAWDHEPATVHGYQLASYLNRFGKERSSDNLTGQMRGFGQLTGQMEMSSLRSPSGCPAHYRDSLAFAMGQQLQNGFGMYPAPGFQNVAISRNGTLPSERPYLNFSSSVASENLVGSVNNKKYHSLPDISGYSIPLRDINAQEKNVRRENPIGYGSSISRMHYEPTLYSNPGTRMTSPLAFDEVSPSKVYSDAHSQQLSSGLETGSFWSKPPFEQFGVADKSYGSATGVAVSRQSSVAQETTTIADSEAKLLQLFRHCIIKLLRLEGSDRLFGHHDGVDEDLIDCVAARVKFLYEAEAQCSSSERKSGSAAKNNEASITNILVSSVPNCGEGCVWRSDLIVSFGVWCIHRILDLSIMESRPELWGKYTYVLNYLQGIIESAFVRPRNTMVPCFCLQVPGDQQQRSTPSASNGMLPPTAKQSRGKCTTAAMILDLIKNVELSISCRKGRSGTAAGDVAFPKGKENLASVLKRYKRRLSNKSVGAHEGTGSRKALTPVSYG